MDSPARREEGLGNELPRARSGGGMARCTIRGFPAECAMRMTESPLNGANGEEE
jgi:hypothetical protein